MDEALQRLLQAHGTGALALLESRAGAYLARRAYEDEGDEPRRAVEGLARVGRVGLLRLSGIIIPDGPGWLEAWGLAPLSLFRRRLDRAAASGDLDALVIRVDSPGGFANGVPEAAAAVARAAGAKPVIVVTEYLAASAAYWIASQATELVVAPSGDVGSIGVFAAHTSYAEKLKQDGIEVTVIRSTPQKAEGTPWEPLGEDARDHQQSIVDRIHEEFVLTVARGRRVSPATVRSEAWGRGRLVSAHEAVAAGMADRVGELGDTVAGLAASGTGNGGKRAAVDRASGDGLLLAARLALA